jgi:hypothetical protein
MKQMQIERLTGQYQELKRLFGGHNCHEKNISVFQQSDEIQLSQNNQQASDCTQNNVIQHTEMNLEDKTDLNTQSEINILSTNGQFHKTSLLSNDLLPITASSKVADTGI